MATMHKPPKFLSGTITGGSHVSARLTVIAQPESQIVIDSWGDGFTSMWHYRNGQVVDWDGGFEDDQ